MLATTVAPSTFTDFGIRPVINACGIYTDLGGTVLSPRVWKAMHEINQSFVRMVDLLDRSGEIIASLVGAEAARVVPGASAAITLGTAACIAGQDGAAWQRLPDTSGLKNEVIIQKAHRYKYDRMVSIAGGRLVEVGTEQTASTRDFEQAFNSRTAMVMFPAHLEGRPGSLSLQSVHQVAQRHHIPVLVDAAYLNYPTSIMNGLLRSGADLLCSSAKYFWGPNSGGFICGRRDLVQSVAGIDFTRYESGKYLTFGRPFKLDRHIIIATVVALQEWFELDHEARWSSYREKVAVMRQSLGEVPGIRTQARHLTMDERLADQPVNCMTIEFPDDTAAADRISSELMSGNPQIATLIIDGKLVVAADTLLDEDHLTIVKRLQSLLKSAAA